VIQNWNQTPCEIHFLERKDKWLLFSNPQVNFPLTTLIQFELKVILERKQAQGQPSREERHKILQKWFPDRGGFNYPGFDGHSVVRDTIFYKNDTKDKWTKKYIELRGHKLLIFKVMGILYISNLYFTFRKNLRAKKYRKRLLTFMECSYTVVSSGRQSLRHLFQMVLRFAIRK